MRSTRYQKHVEFVTVSLTSLLCKVWVCTCTVACHRMRVQSEASLCYSRPRSGQEPEGPGFPSFPISIPGV